MIWKFQGQTAESAERSHDLGERLTSAMLGPCWLKYVCEEETSWNHTDSFQKRSNLSVRVPAHSFLPRLYLGNQTRAGLLRYSGDSDLLPRTEQDIFMDTIPTTRALAEFWGLLQSQHSEQSPSPELHRRAAIQQEEWGSSTRVPGFLPSWGSGSHLSRINASIQAFFVSQSSLQQIRRDLVHHLFCYSLIKRFYKCNF